MSAASRFNVIVYGATGFTARQLVRYLVLRGVSGWAVAGRRRAAIEQLAEKPSAVPVLAATLDDPAALRELTQQATVVLNLAGPYEPHAEALIAACIETGTHYADLSGEIPFTRTLIDRYHDAACRAAVTIVPQCGYESLPFDLLTAALHQTFRSRDGSALRAIEITAHFTLSIHPLRAGLGMSGGTVASIAAFARPLGPGRLIDPFALTPQPPEHVGENAITLIVRRDPSTGHWIAPTVPAPFVNPAVIHRTNALADDPYAPDFTYREAFDATASLTRAPFAARASARGLTRLVQSVVALSEERGRRADRLRLRALTTLGPRPGAGPTPRQLDGTGYHLKAHAVSDSGATATASIDAQGNAGYRSTPNLLAEAGLALASGDAKRAGIVTPALALGPELLEHLTPAGINYTPEPR
jgi:short subunit dehydrogenase-like uncharacterized protein